jgi:hypothetical protein
MDASALSPFHSRAREHHPSSASGASGGAALLPCALLLLLACLLLPAQPARAAVVGRDVLQDYVDASGTARGEVADDVNFSNTADSVFIHNMDTSLRGTVNSNLAQGISALDGILLGRAVEQRSSGTAAALAAFVQSRVNAFSTPAGMTYIDGGGASRIKSSANVTDFETVRWLTIPDTTNDNLGLANLHLKNVKVNDTFSLTSAGGVVNGLIGSAYGISADISMGDLLGNSFSGIEVTLDGYRDTHYLAGGGVVGLRSTASTASMGNVVGNMFKDVTVITRQSTNPGANGSAYIEGGGLIGLDAVSSPSVRSGYAEMTSLTDNLFTDIEVNSGDVIMGGGLVGLNNNSKDSIAALKDTTHVRLLAAGGNIFGNGYLGASDADIHVKAGYSLRGGGVLGLNGLSTAAVELGSLTDNIFAGILVEAGTYIRGGGIVGLQSNNSGEVPPDDPVTARLGNVNNNLFLNLRVTTGSTTLGSTTGGGLEGGGIIGVRSNEGMAALDGMANNIFKGLEVTVNPHTGPSAGILSGGGIAGASSADAASLLGIRGNYFDELRVSTTGAAGHVRGGGILGASSTTLTLLDNISDNDFRNLNLTLGGAGANLYGGGVVGADAEPAGATQSRSYINALTNNRFSGTTTIGVTGNIFGGGVAGAYINSANPDSAAGLGNVSGNSFAGANVTAANLSGGGVVGFAADGDASGVIDSLSANTFTGSRVNVAGNIAGGGIVGGHIESDNSNSTAGARSIAGNRFTGVNNVTAGSISGGGVIGFDSGGGAAGDAGNAYIDSVTDNVFSGPRVTTTGAIRGGGVLGVRSDYGVAYIDRVLRNTFQGAIINAGTYIDGGGIIGATGETAGGGIIGIGSIEKSSFTGNRVSADGSILGGLVYSYGLVRPLAITDSSFTDNTFTSTTGTVYGAVSVDTALTHGPGFVNDLTLAATPGGQTIFRNNRINDPQGSRTNSLYFGTIDDPATGTPDPAHSDARLTVSAQAGGTVALYDPIRVNQVNNDAAHPDRTFGMNVRGGGDFLWGGDNLFETGVYNAAVHSVENKVTFEPGSTTTLLSGMSLRAVNHDFNLNTGGRINVMGRNVLTVNQANLNGRLHFNLPATVMGNVNTALLKIHHPGGPGQTSNADLSGSTVSLTDLPAGTPLPAGAKFYLIDTDDDNYLQNAPLNNYAYARQGLTMGYNFIIDKQGMPGDFSRQLVARLPADGSGAGAARETRIFSEGRAAGLAFLSRFSSWLADHSYQQADLALKGEDGWTPFGGVDGALFRADTGSLIDIQGATMLAGVAFKRSGDAASILVGGFFEAGFASYDIQGDFNSPGRRNISGRGDLNFYGGGLMGRLRWHNGFRIEGSFRGGQLENKFSSRDYVDVNGTAASYEFTTPYFAAHAGLAYEWRINETSTLDFLTRYFWVGQNGVTTDLPTGEKVKFDPDNSHRLRAGMRYTHAVNELFSWYVGAAYEHEFDNRPRGSAYGYDFDIPSLRGDGGVGEIGLIARSANNFTIEAGLQGHVGRVSGVTGGVRIGWEF